MRTSVVSAYLLLALLVGAASPASAQVDPVPVDPDAELVFDQAIRAFEEGDYGMAYRRFRLVYSAYPLHRKTTGALLMAGKALYRSGDYAQAAELLGRLVEAYPTSGYVEEARHTRALALEQLGEGVPAPQVVELGILLPMGAQNTALTQALFNGIRVAVEEHNADGRPAVRMVFRESGADPVEAEAATAALVQEGADVIVGPLYSEQARAAARVAERSGVPLLVPLATEEDVAEGRSYVLQANPSITMRGRLIGRYAVEVLGHRRVAVVAEQGDAIGQRMAAGFREGVESLGGEVVLDADLPDASAWGALPSMVDVGRLRQAEALYVPFSGGGVRNRARAVLSGLREEGVDLRVLGNVEWQDLGTSSDAAQYGVTYANDFYVDDTAPAAQAYARRYQERFGQGLGRMSFTERRLAYTGYDLARFLLQQIEQTGGEGLAAALRNAPPYQGLGVRLDFRGGSTNQAMYFFGFRNAQPELLR